MQSINCHHSSRRSRLKSQPLRVVKRQFTRHEGLFLLHLKTSFLSIMLDFASAFDSLRREVMLKTAFEAIPELYRFIHQTYGTASFLRYDQYSKSSQMGPQQGDPLSPVIFLPSTASHSPLCTFDSSLRTAGGRFSER